MKHCMRATETRRVCCKIKNHKQKQSAIPTYVHLNIKTNRRISGIVIAIAGSGAGALRL